MQLADKVNVTGSSPEKCMHNLVVAAPDFVPNVNGGEKSLETRTFAQGLTVSSGVELTATDAKDEIGNQTRKRKLSNFPKAADDSEASKQLSGVSDSMLLQDPLHSLAMMAELHAQQGDGQSAAVSNSHKSTASSCDDDSPSAFPQAPKRRFSLPTSVPAGITAVNSANRAMLQQLAGAVSTSAVNNKFLILPETKSVSGVTITPNSVEPHASFTQTTLPSSHLEANHHDMHAGFAEYSSQQKDKLYARSPEMKVSHKLAERKRRQEINDLFVELRNILPVDPAKAGKTSKWEILSRTIEYLDYYKLTHSQFLSERAAHLSKIKQLQQILAENNLKIPEPTDLAAQTTLKRVDSKVSGYESCSEAKSSSPSPTSSTLLRRPLSRKGEQVAGNSSNETLNELEINSHGQEITSKATSIQ